MLIFFNTVFIQSKAIFQLLCTLEKPLTAVKQITVIDGMGDLLKRNPNLEALETKIDELSSLHNTLLVTTNSDKILTTRVGYVISESTLFGTKVTKFRISTYLHQKGFMKGFCSKFNFS